MAEPRQTKLEPSEQMVKDLGELSLLGPSGAVWGLDSTQLNANLVTLRAGESMPEHGNDEVDVLVIVRSGSGYLTIDAATHAVGADTIALIPRGANRSLRTGVGLTYLTVHARRGGLGISPVGNSSG